MKGNITSFQLAVISIWSITVISICILVFVLLRNNLVDEQEFAFEIVSDKLASSLSVVIRRHIENTEVLAEVATSFNEENYFIGNEQFMITFTKVGLSLFDRNPGTITYGIDIVVNKTEREDYERISTNYWRKHFEQLGVPNATSLDFPIINGATTNRDIERDYYLPVATRVPLWTPEIMRFVNIGHHLLVPIVKAFNRTIQLQETVLSERSPIFLPNEDWSIFCFAPITTANQKRSAAALSLFGVRTALRTAIQRHKDAVGISIYWYDISEDQENPTYLQGRTVKSDGEDIYIPEISSSEIINSNKESRLFKEIEITVHTRRWLLLVTNYNDEFQPIETTTLIVVTILTAVVIPLCSVLFLCHYQARKLHKLELTRQKEETHQNVNAYLCHELRNPLHAIQHLIEEVQEGHEAALVELQASVSYMISLVNDFLDFSKCQVEELPNHLVESDVSNIVRDCYNQCKILGGRSNTHLKYVLEIPESVISKQYLVDSVKLRQILYNSLSNASKYTEKGEIKIVVYEQDEDVCIDVIDSGIGLGQIDPDSLFQDYNQGITKGRGAKGTTLVASTGLGLGICKKLAGAMNGEILLENRSDGTTGTIFSLKFPKKIANIEVVVDKPENHHIPQSTVKPIMNESITVGIKGEDIENLELDLQDPFILNTSKTDENVDIMIVYNIEQQNEEQLVNLTGIHHRIGVCENDKDIKPVYFNYFDTICHKSKLKKNIKRLWNETTETFLWKQFRWKIVAAEDEPVINRILDKMIQSSFSQQSKVYLDGLDILQHLEDNFFPDLVLCDIVMKRSHGEEIIQEIKKKYPDLPVIAVTGNSTVIDIERYKSIGFNQVIIKPFSKEQLITEVSKLLLNE